MLSKWPRRIILQQVATMERSLREMGEPYRQAVIDLGMMEPPLVEVFDGEWVQITEAGRQALQDEKP